jgi:hypothetical protein
MDKLISAAAAAVEKFLAVVADQVVFCHAAWVVLWRWWWWWWWCTAHLMQPAPHSYGPPPPPPPVSVRHPTYVPGEDKLITPYITHHVHRLAAAAYFADRTDLRTLLPEPIGVVVVVWEVGRRPVVMRVSDRGGSLG